MEFGWTEDEQGFRRELLEFLREALPQDWEEIAKDGPGSDVQAGFSRAFCGLLASRGWLTQHWPREYGGRDASPGATQSSARNFGRAASRGVPST